MSLNKKALSEHLQTILANTRYGFANPSQHYAIHSFLGSDTTLSVSRPGSEPMMLMKPDSEGSVPTLTIVNDGCAALEAFIDECNRDECIGGQVGRQAIEQQIQILVRRWFGTPTDNAGIVGDIRDALKRLRDQVQPWNVYFSVENLVLKDLDDLVIGSARLLPGSIYSSELKASLFKHVDGATYDDNAKQDTKIKIDAHISRFYPTNGTIAVLTVNAENSGLREAAERAVSEVFGVLRGFTHLMFQRKNRCLFNLRGSLLRNSVGWAGAAVNGEFWTLKEHLVGAMAPYEITPERIEHLRKHCQLDRLHDMLVRRRSERTQLEQVVIVAAQWHGAAVNALTPAEEFVWHTVSLERLLICDHETSTTALFSNRLAWLLGDTGVERQRLRGLASRLYDTRSRIVHAGETCVEADDLSNIDDLASHAVIALASRSAEWKCQEEMRNWVDSQLMGA